jgi:hypothetical protein
MWSKLFKVLSRLMLLGITWTSTWAASMFIVCGDLTIGILIASAYWGFGFIFLGWHWSIIPAKKSQENSNVLNWLFWSLGVIGIALLAILWPVWAVDPIDDSIDRAGRWFKQENEENSKPLF